MKKSDLKKIIKECINEAYVELPNTHEVGVVDTKRGKVTYEKHADNDGRIYYDIYDSSGKIGQKYISGYTALHNLESAIKHYIEELKEENWCEKPGASPTSVVEDVESNTTLKAIETLTSNILSKASRISDSPNYEVQNRLKELFTELRGIDGDLQEYIITSLNR